MEQQQALQASGIPAEIRHDLTALTTDAEHILIAPPGSAPARQIRDRALLLVGFAAFRRSVLVALYADDAQITSDGLVIALGAPRPSGR